MAVFNGNKRSRRILMRRLKKFISFAAAIMLALPVLAIAEMDSIGKLEFQKNCAACHGIDGTGQNAPFMDFMKKSPPDLTMIAKKNGGTFPYKQVFIMIQDPAGNRAHGSADMPVWGDRYGMEVNEKYGSLDPRYAKEVEARILELVFYLANIQK